MAASGAGLRRSLALLESLAARDRIPSALLFTGARGTGKKECALFFAMAQNCAEPGAARPENPPAFEAFPPFFRKTLSRAFHGEPPCGACGQCRKIAHGSHPDVLEIAPEGGKAAPQIKVDQIRGLLSTLSMHPIEGKRRVVMMPEAEAMNEAAANALLKALEEPPPSTVFILAVPEPGMLLPTIVSRCQKVRFAPLPEKDIAAFLETDLGHDPARALAAAALSEGSVTRAVELVEKGRLEERDAVLARLARLGSGTPVEALAWAESLARNKKAALRALDWMQIWMRDLLAARGAPKALLNKDLTERLGCETRERAVEEIVTAYHRAAACRRDIERNANLRLALDALFLRFWN
jgi:DNA polymerase-3 subunit delta'